MFNRKIKYTLTKHLLEQEFKINNYEIIDGIKYYLTFVYGYENGYTKLCCFGGTAFKIKSTKEDMMKLISPIIENNFKEGQVIDYCKNTGWKYWDYYNEFFKLEIIKVKNKKRMFLEKFKKWNWAMFFAVNGFALLGSLTNKNIHSITDCLLLVLIFGIPTGLIWAYASRD